jgi:hypothetical protein
MRRIGPTPVTEHPHTVRRVARRPRPRLDWGAVGAGLAVASGIRVALALFGRGTGLGTGLGTGTGHDGAASGGIAALWVTAVLMISLYAGGSATVHVAGDRAAGKATLHGVVLWALATILAEWAAIAGGPPGSGAVAAGRATTAGAWIALLGLGAGLAAAVGGARGWLRR